MSVRFWRPVDQGSSLSGPADRDHLAKTICRSNWAHGREIELIEDVRARRLPVGDIGMLEVAHKAQPEPSLPTEVNDQTDSAPIRLATSTAARPASVA